MDGHVFILMYVAFTVLQIAFRLITDISGVCGSHTSLHSQTRDDIDCNTLYSCNFNRDRNVPYCYCDPHCTVYNDCCIDYINTESGQLTANDQRTTSLHPDKSECMRTVSLTVGVYQVVKCLDRPDDIPKDTRETIFDVIPVTANNNTVYKNMYIALCNNETEFTFWNILFDLTSCVTGIDETQISNKSAPSDIAAYLLDQGCGYKTFPKEDYHLRFCFIFKQPTSCGNDTLRLPIQTMQGLFWNRECCRRFMTDTVGTNPCNKCSPIVSDKLENGNLWFTRYTSSMHVLFQYKEYSSVQDETNGGTTKTTVHTVFRNTVFRRLMTFSTSADFNDTQWKRAAYFIKLCLEGTLVDFSPILEYKGYTYLRRENGSTISQLIQYTDIAIRKDVHSYGHISRISTWLDDLKVRYQEHSKHGTTEFDVTSRRFDTIYLCQPNKKPACKAYGSMSKLNDDTNNALIQMGGSSTYPDLNCTYIRARVDVSDLQKSFTVQCTSIKKHVEEGDWNGKLLVVIKFSLICVSSLFLFIIIYCHRKNCLHDTILGYSYIILVSVSLLHQCVTAFSDYYHNPLLCNYMKLTSRTLTLMKPSIAISGSLSIIYFILKTNGNEHKSLLKNKVMISLTFVPSITTPIFVTLVTHLLSNEQIMQSETCNIHYFDQGSFAPVFAATNVLLIFKLIISFVLYLKRRHEIPILRAYIPFLLAYTSVNFTSALLIFTAYSQNQIVVYWLYFTAIGLQTPLLSLPLLIFH